MTKNDIQREITEFKSTITDKILNSDLSDLEKLELIDDNVLWPIEREIQCPFEDSVHYDTLDRECTAKYGYSCIDDWFVLSDSYRKGDVISIVEDINTIKMIYDKDEQVLILKNRRDIDQEEERVYVSVDECVQILIDFCFKHKITSFRLDW